MGPSWASFGTLLCSHNGSKMLPTLSQYGPPYGANMVPKWLPNVSQSVKNRSREASWTLLGVSWPRSWKPLGTLLDGSRTEKKLLLSGSWLLQEEVQERFQPSRGPSNSQNGARACPNSGSRSDPNLKEQNHTTLKTSYDIR